MRRILLVCLALGMLVASAPLAAAHHCDNYPQWPRRLICELTHVEAGAGASPAEVPVVTASLAG